jgi:sec-independent protein translocase protein TatA
LVDSCNLFIATLFYWEKKEPTFASDSNIKSMNTLAVLLLIGGIGGAEIALILFIFIVLLGAKRIPELAKGLGKGIREFKEATKEVEKEIEE